MKAKRAQLIPRTFIGGGPFDGAVVELPRGVMFYDIVTTTTGLFRVHRYNLGAGGAMHYESVTVRGRPIPVSEE